ncbi:hypothetical protein EUGRSUZ_D01175 [Eucalyptus grandis]|uniref:Uncharacterized protein n=2 Tax=Eucalyptus grandis TaxID=71139 RepID=A0ACC3L771_EUCGR|nr:hypothetical protein EUGRSUZ_D01175 [Eucalyptus grandis]
MSWKWSSTFRPEGPIPEPEIRTQPSSKSQRNRPGTSSRSLLSGPTCHRAPLFRLVAGAPLRKALEDRRRRAALARAPSWRHWGQLRGHQRGRKTGRRKKSGFCRKKGGGNKYPAN